MKLLFFALLTLGSLSAMARGNELVSFEETESSMNGRLEGYKRSTIVEQNVKQFEEKHKVKCSEGEVTTGPMDNPLINSNIYTTVCLGEQELRLKIISKFKTVMELANGKMLARYKLNRITLKILK